MFFAHWTWENLRCQEGYTPLAAAQLQSARFAAAQIYRFYPELISRWIFTLLTVRQDEYCSFWWDVTVRGDKRGVPEQQHFSQSPAMNSTALRHRCSTSISHTPGQAVGSATLAEGTVKWCCSPAPRHVCAGTGRQLQDAPPGAPTVQFVFIGILRYQNIAIEVSDPSDRRR